MSFKNQPKVKPNLKNRMPEPKPQNVKKFNFDAHDLKRLQDIEIGIVNAGATMDGLQIYKNMILSQTYERLGIAGDPPKGFSKSIRYNLRQNIIEYSEIPNNTENPDMKLKNEDQPQK